MLKNNEKTLTHWLANWFTSWKTKRKNKDDRVEQENDECLIELGGKKKDNYIEYANLKRWINKMKTTVQKWKNQRKQYDQIM